MKVAVPAHSSAKSSSIAGNCAATDRGGSSIATVEPTTVRSNTGMTKAGRCSSPASLLVYPSHIASQLTIRRVANFSHPTSASRPSPSIAANCPSAPGLANEALM